MPNKNTQNICDETNFESIYNQYAKDLRRFIFFKTQDIKRAEDIVQDSFVKLWNNCKRVNSLKVKSYLFTMANNMFLNEIKHEKVVRKHQSNYKEDKNIESPEFIIIEKEFLDKLERTIASLPDKQKEVFLLNRIEKKKYKDIAVQLNISVKAVEKRMHQALLVLRKEIGNV